MQVVRTLTVIAALALSCGTHAFAGEEMLSLDAKSRAKIAKEKIRSGAQQRKMDQQSKDAQSRSLDENGCGSQSIGNIDTNGRGGPAPREVFVFAPNAINIVGSGGCR